MFVFVLIIINFSSVLYRAVIKYCKTMFSKSKPKFVSALALLTSTVIKFIKASICLTVIGTKILVNVLFSCLLKRVSGNGKSEGGFVLRHQ